MKINMTVDMYVGMRGLPHSVSEYEGGRVKFHRLVGLFARDLHVSRHGHPSKIVVAVGSSKTTKAYGDGNHDLLDQAYDMAACAWRELVEDYDID